MKKINLKVDISALKSNFQQEYEKATENMVGTAQVPIGLAGPLKFNLLNNESKEKINISSYLPLATTEGALVASVNRGCKVLRNSASCEATVSNNGITRAPVVRLAHMSDGKIIQAFLVEEVDLLNSLIKEISSHTRLLGADCKQLGLDFYIRFRFDTDKAMGMNMATIASKKLIDYLENKFGCQMIALSSNFCTDKKPSWSNLIEGRGREVNVRTVISNQTIYDILHCDTDSLMQVYKAKLVKGSFLSGTTGFNAHFANIAAAVFIATGQDPAHVVEAAQGMTEVELIDNGLAVSCWIPNLVIGLVGGGTKYPTQQACLNIINHQNSLSILAGIIGAGMLAGEISLLASIAENSLAQSHIKLGRK